ncbi:DNase I-like protein [Coprinellus micaceus]|uniref:DNase I-like protein n=1 Tax=Coprinellus micaceus TaxID=71717 RepID=A0A4Y7SQ75_COPMI|nr:DNase I-like protein [Coprinellus micaceus]
MNGGGSNRSEAKWANINYLLKSESINILALQETHLTEEASNLLGQKFNRFRILASPHPTHPTNRGGVAILINKHNTRWESAISEEIIPGRALLAKFELNDGGRLNILAVYAPSGDDTANAEFWTLLSSRLTDTGIRHIDIMLGDMNMVENRYDRFPPHPDRQSVVDALQHMKTSWDLRDGWKVLNPDKNDHTFQTKRRNGQINSRSRIDRIYVRDALIDRCDEWRISETGVGTDHSLVSVYFTPKGTPFVGPGRSSVPDFILEYPDVRRGILARAKAAADQIHQFARLNNRTNESNPQTIWHTLKREIMDLTKEMEASTQ